MNWLDSKLLPKQNMMVLPLGAGNTLPISASLFPEVTLLYSVSIKTFLFGVTSVPKKSAIFQSNFSKLKANLVHLTAQLSVCPSLLIPIFSSSVSYPTT